MDESDHESMTSSHHEQNSGTPVPPKTDGQNHLSLQTPQESTAHHSMMIADYKRRFIVSLLVTLPILALSPRIQEWLGLSIAFPGSMYLLFVLSTFVFFYGGWPFLKGIIGEVRTRLLGMMTLIAVAISVAYFYSTVVVFGLKGEVFFWELVTLIDIMLLGHWIEMRSVLGASTALEKLASLMPDRAHRIQGDEIIDVQISSLMKGDRVLIKPGEKIPADGIVVKGSSYVNESMLTGESKSVRKQEGGSVIGGSINGDGSLEFFVRNIGEDSYLSKVIILVREAQASKSKTQLLADKAAFWLTVIALTFGVLTLVSWVVVGKDLAFAIERMATVMVIACPHALGLAVPLVVAISTALSAKNGLLIRNRTAFENSRRITTVVFDKTGTLTEGKFGVSAVQSFDPDVDEKRIIELAASLEKNSEHPIATGILSKAQEMKVVPFEVSDFQTLKGKGVEGLIQGKSVRIVSPGYLKEKHLEPPPMLKAQESDTNVFVVLEDRLVGVVSLSDKIRKESYRAIERLQNNGIRCWMLTGDNAKTAKTVSDALHLDGFFAEVLPHEKQEKIKELQSKGTFVAMTGDGVNDAPALAQADVGIAIGSGTDVAAETADIILVNSNPADVSSLILFGKATYRKMMQNLFWATGYNVVALPLAAGVLYGQGILLTPAVGAIFMSVSTVIVAINAQLLKIRKEENA